MKLAKEQFENIAPIWNENSSLCDDSIQDTTTETKAQWTGGSCIVEKTLINHYQDQLPDLAHLVIGFESMSPTEKQ